jgi:hypothetical protein
MTWGLPIVNHTWLEDCFAQWRLISPANMKYVDFPPGLDFAAVLGERGLGRAVVEEEEIALVEADMDREERRAGKAHSGGRARARAEMAAPVPTGASAGDAMEVEPAVELDPLEDTGLDEGANVDFITPAATASRAAATPSTHASRTPNKHSSHSRRRALTEDAGTSEQAVADTSEFVEREMLLDGDADPPDSPSRRVRPKKKLVRRAGSKDASAIEIDDMLSLDAEAPIGGSSPARLKGKGRALEDSEPEEVASEVRVPPRPKRKVTARRGESKEEAPVKKPPSPRKPSIAPAASDTEDEDGLPARISTSKAAGEPPWSKISAPSSPKKSQAKKNVNPTPPNAPRRLESVEIVTNRSTAKGIPVARLDSVRSTAGEAGGSTKRAKVRARTPEEMEDEDSPLTSSPPPEVIKKRTTGKGNAAPKVDKAQSRRKKALAEKEDSSSEEPTAKPEKPPSRAKKPTAQKTSRPDPSLPPESELDSSAPAVSFDASQNTAGRARRGAAIKADTKLKNDVMPDLLNYEKDRKRGVVRGVWETIGGLRVTPRGDTEETDGWKPQGKKRVGTADVDEVEGDRKVKKRKANAKAQKQAPEDDDSDEEEVQETKAPTRTQRAEAKCVMS